MTLEEAEALIARCLETLRSIAERPADRHYTKVAAENRAEARERIADINRTTT